MGNYKDYGVLIDSLVERGKPFLIVKYSTVFLDMANNTYEIVTIGGRLLRYTPIDRKEALEAIRRYELPLLHKVDSRNMIWGTTDFKQAFRKKGVSL